MKSNQFGLGFEYNRTMNIDRMNVLIFITTLASIVAILTALTVEVADMHRRFQANTTKRRVLSFQTLGLRAWRQRMGFSRRQVAERPGYSEIDDYRGGTFV